MDQQTKRKITNIWGSICPEEFRQIIPATFFTSMTGKTYNGTPIYPRISIKHNPDMSNFRQVTRKNSSTKLHEPFPVQRFRGNETLEKLFQSMISSKDKIILMKQTPIYDMNNVSSTSLYSSLDMRSEPGHMIIGGDIIAISQKGVLFFFIYDASFKVYRSGSTSHGGTSWNYDGVPQHTLKKIDIYNLSHGSKSLSKNFMTNVLGVYIDNFIYSTTDLVQKRGNLHSVFDPPVYAHLDPNPQIKLSEFINTLIVLIYAYMHSRGSDTQQQIITCRQADKQQALKIVEKISENLKEFAKYHQDLKKNRQQYLKSMNQKTSQVLKAPMQMLDKSFGAHLKQFTQSHQNLSKKQEQSVKKLLQVIQRIKQPLPPPTQKQQKEDPIQQGYFEKQQSRLMEKVGKQQSRLKEKVKKQQSRLKEVQNSLKERQKKIQQQENKLIELPEYLTDVAGDLGILIDPVIASDGFTYSRRTAQNIIRNRLNGRAGERLRILGKNHDVKKALDDFNSKYILINDNKYKKR